MSARCGPRLLGCALGLIALLPVSAQAQALVLYDDFSSGELSLGEPPDPGLWVAFEYLTAFARRSQLGPTGIPNGLQNPLTRHPINSMSNTAARRRIVGGRLQLRLESAGGAHPDPDVVPGQGRIGVTGTQRPFAPARNAVQATVIPMAAAAPACRATGESRVRAQLVMRILETWQPAERRPAFATLSLERSSFGGDRIHAVVSRCRGSAGGFWMSSFAFCPVVQQLGEVVFTRTWTMGSAHTLRIEYMPDSDEPDNSRVLFTVAGGGLGSETRILSRVPADSNPGDLGRHFDLRVETLPANCPATGEAPAERVPVMMDVRFDAVRVGGQ
jgi:hypothetical protein